MVEIRSFLLALHSKIPIAKQLSHPKRPLRLREGQPGKGCNPTGGYVEEHEAGDIIDSDVGQAPNNDDSRSPTDQQAAQAMSSVRF